MTVIKNKIIIKNNKLLLGKLLVVVLAVLVVLLVLVLLLLGPVRRVAEGVGGGGGGGGGEEDDAPLLPSRSECSLLCEVPSEVSTHITASPCPRSDTVTRSVKLQEFAGAHDR